MDNLTYQQAFVDKSPTAYALILPRSWAVIFALGTCENPGMYFKPSWAVNFSSNDNSCFLFAIFTPIL